MNKLFLRGILGHSWYNFTEMLVQMLVLKKNPENLIYTKKIKYGDGKLQYINTYSQKGNNDIKKPLLIYIHGGSWVSGITEMRNPYISLWANSGFNTAAISYSYAPEKIFPAQLKEVFSAIDYIADNAEKLKVDTQNIVLAGESAGGYFVSYIASSAKNKDSLKKLGINFRHADDIKIKAMVTLSGCFDLKRLSDKKYPQASYPDLKMMYTTYLGKNHKDALSAIHGEGGEIYSPAVNDGYPPAFLVWGDKDLLRYESFDFAKELEHFGIEHKLYKADGSIGMHAWSIIPLFKKTHICFEKTLEFILPFLD